MYSMMMRRRRIFFTSPLSRTKTLLLLLYIYLLANLKSLPFAWHVRVFYHFFNNVVRTPIASPPKPRSKPQPQSQPPKTGRDNNNNYNNIQVLTHHPLFAPAQISTRTTILETDFNLHKSNSTYLTDMDVSRAKLLARITIPGFRKLDLQLEREGYRGRMTVALGAVHVSFRREVGVYERVWVRSRVLAWDEKWLVVVSYFVRKGRKKQQQGEGQVQVVEQPAGRGGEEGGQAVEDLCTVGLSKYVLKKGRFTVRPERLLTMGGWLPMRPGDGSENLGGTEKNSNGTLDVGDKTTSAPAGLKDDDGGKGDEREGGGDGPSSIQTPKTLAGNADAWSWEEIEKERCRGLQLVEEWIALDRKLYGEFEGN